MGYSERGIREMVAVENSVRRLKDKHVAALCRTAKKPNGGVRPFFANPHAMRGLRNEAQRRRLTPCPWLPSLRTP